ncbi:hypothetical protein MMC15_004916 [Xylographa vitiligo]|nr:hypothetical protein [Xylographa vitiligo]
MSPLCFLTKATSQTTLVLSTNRKIFAALTIRMSSSAFPPPLAPPFTASTAHAKVKAAQILWNTQSASAVTKAYTPTCIWRNRSTFLQGSVAIEAFLEQKWAKEKSYRLRKELFSFTENKIAVQFWYEYQDAGDEMRWKRCYGLEDWTFDADGKMRKRMMSGNDVEIAEGERWFREGMDVDSVKIGEEHW